VHISVKAALLAGMHPVLTDMIPVIRRVEYISVVQLSGRIENLDHLLHHLVHGLEGSESGTLELVIVLNDGVIQSRKILDPAHASLNFGVEVFRSGDVVILEQMGVAVRIHGLVGEEFGEEMDIGVGGNGGVNEEEWFFMRKGLVEESVGLLGSNIRRVFARIVHGRATVSGHGRIAVLVSMRVEQEVGLVEATGIRRVIILNSVVIPELAAVVGVVTNVL
jgi:hypothetical protein